LDGGCHIVVGTPGRLRDHIERGQLQLDQLRAVVLDEADEMLDLGFREELEEILDAAPRSRRTLLFSATLPKPIVSMARTYQDDALRLTVGAGEETHGDIDYRAMRISPSEVELATVNVLRYFESGAALVFCATREAVRRLHANLVERGFSVVALSGELTQNERTRALQSLRDGRARVCVATDVAARGIDIPDLDLVIHADLPRTREVLQHRSGRTGRAGRKGTSVILVPHPRWKRMQQLLHGAGLEVTWENPPNAEAIRARDLARLIEEVPETPDAADDELAAVGALTAARSLEAIAAAYVRLARSRAPAPEDLSGSVAPEPRAYAPAEDRAPEAPRPGFEDAVWFKIDLGRNRNAEARWLLPLLCRRGHATKRDFGAIRIFDRETRFQVTAEAAERFEAAAAKGDADGGRIVRLAADAPPAQARGRDDRRPTPRKPAKSAAGDREERSWTPPLRGDEPRPPKPAKAKPPKKRRSNG
jgi:ATP-dependent RNA helicase DeaD